MKIAAVHTILLSAPYTAPDDAGRTIHLKSGYRLAELYRPALNCSTVIFGLGDIGTEIARRCLALGMHAFERGQHESILSL